MKPSKSKPGGRIPFKPRDVDAIRAAHVAHEEAVVLAARAAAGITEAIAAGVRALGFDPDGDVKLSVDLITMTVRANG